jgi:hypothetical protein
MKNKSLASIRLGLPFKTTTNSNYSILLSVRSHNPIPEAWCVEGNTPLIALFRAHFTAADQTAI